MSGAISVHHGAFGRAALYELDRPIITHAHREAHLVFFVDGSKASVRVCDVGIEINNQQAAAVSPWQPHSFEIGEVPAPCMCLVLYIKPIWFLENSQSVEHALSFGGSHIDMTKSISQWVFRLTSLLLEQEGSELFDGFLYEMTRQCYEQSWRDKPRVGLMENARTKYIDFRVRRSIRLMKESFTDDVEIEWLARESGLSRPHFFKLFKKQMGITANLYLNTLRAQQAIDDLMTTNKTVTDIGYDLGFSSQASFTRFFTSNVGIPPSDYRRVAHIA